MKTTWTIDGFLDVPFDDAWPLNESLAQAARGHAEAAQDLVDCENELSNEDWTADGLADVLVGVAIREYLDGYVDDDDPRIVEIRSIGFEPNDFYLTPRGLFRKPGRTSRNF